MTNSRLQINLFKSSGIQVAGNLITGVSIEDAKQVALDIFKDNFLILSEQAANTALVRAEELVNEFILTLYDRYQNYIHKLQDPAIQYSLFNVQRDYAKSGDSELKKQQLYLLIERTISEERTLKQIVLDEAIETLPKLAAEQLNFLSFIFIADNLTVKLFQNKFTKDIDFNIIEIMDNLKLFCDFSSKDLRQHVVGHLQYLGCIREISDNDDMFSPTSHIKRLVETYRGQEVPDEDVIPILKSIHTNLAMQYRLWKMSNKRTVKLTTVGLIIAITHYNRYANIQINLEDFI
ncbi:MAG: hypothetical protein LBI15_04165 [Dysgonamonadaceae bacterium]|jgi:hypothetical protein|nr:hypothetical protein [Dysgonamonadaceae bacterium]